MKSYRQLLTYDPISGYRYVKDLRVTVTSEWDDMLDYRIETDGNGLRNSDNSWNSFNSDPLIDVVFAGCSFTAGDGVENNARFSELVGTQTYNMGLPGSCMVQQAAILGDVLRSKSINTLVLTPHIGCITRNLEKVRSSPMFGSRHEWKKPSLTIDRDGMLRLRKAGKPILDYAQMKKPVEGKKGRSFSERLIGRVFNTGREINTYLNSWERCAEVPESRRVMCEVMRYIKCNVRAKRIIVAPIPTCFYIKRGRKKLRESVNMLFWSCAKEEGLQYERIEDSFRARDYASLFYAEGHFNKNGHVHMAELLRGII